MKRLILSLLFLVSVQLSAQQSWTVETVPNTRLQGDNIHVSDPDGILSDSAETIINSSLQSIRDKADVFVVTLNSIGDEPVETFSEQLFKYWGIGDKEKDNGVLMLLAVNQRQHRFETGYGVETVLSDLTCYTITEHYMIPFFKEGEYEKGVCSGVTQVVEAFGGTVAHGIYSEPPKTGEIKSAQGSQIMDEWLLTVLQCCIGISLFSFIVSFWSNKSEEKDMEVDFYWSKTRDGVTYLGENGEWSGEPWGNSSFARALFFGMPIGPCIFVAVWLVKSIGLTRGYLGLSALQFAYSLIFLLFLFFYLTCICVAQNIRALRVAKKYAACSLLPDEIYKKARDYRQTENLTFFTFWIGFIFKGIFNKLIEEGEQEEPMCKICHTPVSEQKNHHYSELQELEQSIGSVEYFPCVCKKGHETICMATDLSKYHLCPACQGFTEVVKSRKKVRRARRLFRGTEELECECIHCHAKRTRLVHTPKLKPIGYSGGSSSSNDTSYSSSSYDDDSSSSSSRSSGSSRGSFGGGRSGGGGYTGKW